MSKETNCLGAFEDLETVGVLSDRSGGYVQAMLDNLEAGVVSVPLRSSEDYERMERARVKRTISPAPLHGWLKRAFTSRPGPEPAMVSFSSGTEGAPKAVLLTRGNLHDSVERLTAAMKITDDIREYVGVPVYHSFGYGRCRVVLNAGGAVWLPRHGFDLAEIRRMLAVGEINAISAVPSQWRIFLENLDLFGPELAGVRWVEIGSQYMSADEKLRLRQALPEARIVQHYGLTEASRATLLRIHSENASHLESVGRAEGRTRIRINDHGRIELRGPHVAMRIDDDVATRHLAEGDWLETGDLGRIEDGLLYFLGRADDVINCAGIKISPDMAETHVRHNLAVEGDFGILRSPDPLRGDGILVVLTPEAEPQTAEILATVREYSLSLGLDPANSLRSATVAALPRTPTGKLQRQALMDQLAQTEVTVETPTPDMAATLGKSYLADLIDTVMGQGASASDKSFLESDADSLVHMQLHLALERVFGTPPAGWEELPLKRLLIQAETAPLVNPVRTSQSGASPLPRGDRNMNPPDLSFWALVREDFHTNDASLTSQGFLMLFVHRFGNWRMDVQSKLLRVPLTVIYRILNKLTQLLFGMKLDYTVQVGRRVKLEHFGGMILGARAVGNDVILRQNTTLGIRSVDDLNAKPVIGNYVDIGAGAVIVGNITIGDNSIIGANSVVYTNVPEGSVVVGVPGRVIGRNHRQNPSPLRFHHPASEHKDQSR